MTEIEIRQRFMYQHIKDAGEKLLSASRQLFRDWDRPRARKSLERFINQQQTKLSLYREGKLDTDAQIALDLELARHKVETEA